MSSSRLSDSPAKMGKTNAKPTLQNGGCRSRTTRYEGRETQRKEALTSMFGHLVNTRSNLNFKFKFRKWTDCVWHFNLIAKNMF